MLRLATSPPARPSCRWPRARLRRGGRTAISRSVTDAPASRTLSAPDLYDRALAVADQGRPEEAEGLLRTALKVGQTPAMLVTLGVLLEQQRRFDEARAVFRAAVAVAPDEPRLNLPLAINLLRAGKYDEGLRLYEHREVKITAAMSGRPQLPYPEWTGGPVGSLLVLPEQGLGDEMMFNRYVPLLKARGIEVTLLCRPQLARLFAPLGVRLMPLGPKVDVPRCEAWTLAASLPLQFGTTASTVPDPAYLAGGAGGSGIGFVGAGSPGHTSNGIRSIPEDLIAEVRGWPGVVGLQPEEIGGVDFEGARQVIEGLELVLTVDTAVAHLAGAMGKPCWVMLAYACDWRWGERGPHSAWYPAARLFRQPRPGDWASVLAAVKAALAAEGIGQP
ncbi:MAG: glycosyltransferase family 41 protein [Phenylobacterium sp.]|nr:MAG: glycosyltransferase family 41 protein [Phenylobacterium sp.]